MFDKDEKFGMGMALLCLLLITIAVMWIAFAPEYRTWREEADLATQKLLAATTEAKIATAEVNSVASRFRS